jgi:hypothetical protein
MLDAPEYRTGNLRVASLIPEQTVRAGGCFAVMRMGYRQTEETGATIALYLAVCLSVFGFVGLGFYTMLQPHRVSNPGVAAYQPPPATVIPDVPASRFAYAAPPRSQSAAAEPGEISHETSGRATQVAEPAAPVAPTPVPQLKAPAKAEPTARAARTRTVETKHRPSASRTERTASSRPSPEPRSVAIAFPGYAAVR